LFFIKNNFHILIITDPAGFEYVKIKLMKTQFQKIAVWFAVSTILMASIYGGFNYYFVFRHLKQTKKLMASTTTELQEKIVSLENTVSQFKIANTNLVNSLIAEQSKNNFFDEELKKIQGTVGTLEKLSQTDKELLQKYSKIYFLNEHYTPQNLSTIDRKYVYNQDEIYQIHTKVQPYLYRMFDAAASNSQPLEIISAFRSFGVQASLKTSYKITYGSGANQFSADQGYSEHQLGTTIDLTTPSLGASFTKFETAVVYQWLLDNAYQYGFVLSYPKNNLYYQFEPWHWRFVGVSLATKLHNEKQGFYDLEQRVIDAYLVSIFD